MAKFLYFKVTSGDTEYFKNRLYELSELANEKKQFETNIPEINDTDGNIYFMNKIIEKKGYFLFSLVKILNNEKILVADKNDSLLDRIKYLEDSSLSLVSCSFFLYNYEKQILIAHFKPGAVNYNKFMEYISKLLNNKYIELTKIFDSSRVKRLKNIRNIRIKYCLSESTLFDDESSLSSDIKKLKKDNVNYISMEFSGSRISNRLIKGIENRLYSFKSCIVESKSSNHENERIDLLKAELSFEKKPKIKATLDDYFEYLEEALEYYKGIE